MIVYLGLALMPILFRFLLNFKYSAAAINRHGKAKAIYCLLCGLTIFLVIALRSRTVGSTDSTNYYNHWKNWQHYPLAGLPVLMKLVSVEKGYVALVWALSHVFRDPQFIFVFSGAFFAYAVARSVYLHSDTPLISFEVFICLGLYTFMVQGLRQAVAISFCMLSVRYIKDRKFFRFLFLILAAWLFHKTVIVFLIVYPFYGMRFTKGKAIAFGAAGAGAIAVSPFLVGYANQLFNRAYGDLADSGGYVATAIYLLIMAVGVLYAVRHPRDKDYTFWLFLLYIGCTFYIIRYVGVRVAQRVSFYFLFSQMFALPNALNAFDSRSKRMTSIIIVALCIALFLYRLPREGLMPYYFFWQR